MQRYVNGINCLLCTLWARAKAADEAFSETRRHARLQNPLWDEGETFYRIIAKYSKNRTIDNKGNTHVCKHTHSHTRHTHLADTFHENVRIRFGRCRRCRCRCRLVSITRLTADINCPMNPNGNCVNCLTIFQQIY